ncbi:Pycsar system effector family protein [Streptomyces uncialis]|uniref:Pycsar system effector family protein n=1 Tax=Streptomyces uncialis TaxID=1048205 RepID=UPI003818D015
MTNYDRDTALTAAHTEVRAEIARTDQKVSFLLAFTGAALAGLAAITPDLPSHLAIHLIGGTGAALLAAAAVQLLLAARPRIPAGRCTGWPDWARLDTPALHEQLALDRRVEEIATLSRIALAKYQALRRAIDLILTAAALLAVAAAIALTTR